MRMLRLAAFAAVLVAGLAVPAAAQQATGTVSSAQVSVAATATKVADNRPTRSALTIVNGGTVDTFCGSAGVTASNGALLVGTKGATLTLNTSASVWCIVATGTEAVSVLEVY